MTTLEGFSSTGGWAIIEPETENREKFYYTSITSLTNDLVGIIRPFVKRTSPLESRRAGISAPAPVEGAHAAGVLVIPFETLEPAPIPGVETKDPEEFTAPLIDPLLPDLPDGQLRVAGLSLPESGGGTTACKLSQTSWARGGIGEDDAGAVGADPNLGAHAYTEASTGLTSYTKRNATAFMEAGVRFKIVSGPGASGTVTFPWHSDGMLTTIVDAPSGVHAEARATITLRVRDLKESVTYYDQQVALIPSAGPQQGNSRRVYNNDGTHAHSQFFKKRHTYAAYIRVDVRATVSRNLGVDPFTQADAISDYYDPVPDFRAFLDFVKLKFTSYNCNIV